MTRRLLNLLTLLSLMLCLGAALMWTRSHYVRDALHRGSGVYADRGGWGQRDVWFESAGGEFHFWYLENLSLLSPIRSLHPAGWQYQANGHGPGALPPRWLEGRRVMGVEVLNVLRDWGSAGHTRVFMLHVPYWQPFVAGMLLPLILGIRRTRPHPPGYCRRCGYDLRATPGQCPECGSTTSVFATS
jgi:hypothetical protein